ncbi:MAG: hypothetical protein L7T85_06775, partial [Flavobacteriaceae bacterium]|nr:hypothetical protein [Flavobacteriaceae bacterium]
MGRFWCLLLKGNNKNSVLTEQNAVLTVCFPWQHFCSIFTKKIMGYYYGIGGEFYLIAIVFAAISMIVSQRLKSKFKTYSKIQLR